MPTHFAFSDDSKHKAGIYNSLALVTCSESNAAKFHKELGVILKSSGIESEFKWAKLAGARYRLAAQKIIAFVLKNIDKVRIDVLIWNLDDPRHKNVSKRDDRENLVRMYYHLVSTILSKRWPLRNTDWMWYPDKQSSVRWQTLQNCIGNKKHECVADLFAINSNFERVKLSIRPVASHKYPLVQVADLFAGMGAYSWGHFNKFMSWKNSMGQQRLFNQKEIAFTNSEKERFPVMEELRERCGKLKLNVSLENSRGFRSYDPQKHINFWPYEPQHEFDRAPSRIRTQ